jgi:hypothetical protein
MPEGGAQPEAPSHGPYLIPATGTDVCLPACPLTVLPLLPRGKPGHPSLALSGGLEATDLLAGFPNADVAVESATGSPGNIRDFASELLVSDIAGLERKFSEAVGCPIQVQFGDIAHAEGLNRPRYWTSRKGRGRRKRGGLHPPVGLARAGGGRHMLRSRRRDLCLAPLLPLTSHPTRSFVACALQVRGLRSGLAMFTHAE